MGIPRNGAKIYQVGYRLGNPIPYIPFLIIISCLDFKQSQSSLALPKINRGDTLSVRVTHPEPQKLPL
jgi:hypothetical protein